MPPRPIVIDCDPGQDDALAILLALGSPDELEVLAVTAVAGNVPLALTEKNARKMRRARRPAPTSRCTPAATGRWCATSVTAEYVHGATGLDGAELPEPTTPLADGHAVDAIIELLRARPAARSRSARSGRSPTSRWPCTRRPRSSAASARSC